MRDETAKAFVALRAGGQRELYYVDIGGRDNLFRPLSFEEYQLVCDLEKHLDGSFINDTIVRFTLMHTDYDGGLEEMITTGKAGVIDHFAELILKHSGFQNKNRYLDLITEKRQEAKQLDAIMQSYVCAAFNVKPDEFEKLTMERQIKLFAMAEQVAGAEVDVFSILNEEPERGERQEGPPIPQGMESIDFLNDPSMADMPEF